MASKMVKNMRRASKRGSVTPTGVNAVKGESKAQTAARAKKIQAARDRYKANKGKKKTTTPTSRPSSTKSKPASKKSVAKSANATDRKAAKAETKATKKSTAKKSPSRPDNKDKSNPTRKATSKAAPKRTVKAKGGPTEKGNKPVGKSMAERNKAKSPSRGKENSKATDNTSLGSMSVAARKKKAEAAAAKRKANKKPEKKKKTLRGVVKEHIRSTPKYGPAARAAAKKRKNPNLSKR